MPRKRVRRTRRKPARRGRKGRFYKQADRRGEVMVNRTPARLHNVVAPHYYTRLEYGFSGNRAAGAAAQSYFDIIGTCYLPGSPSTGKLFTAAAPQPAGVLVPATLALNALEPVGATVLSNLYESFRVFAAKLDVTYTPSAGADATMMVVQPWADDGVTPSPGTDAQAAMSQPYSKAITCTGNNNVRQNRISLYMDTPTIMGLTKQQFMDDPTVIGQFGSSVGHVPAFRVYFDTLSGAVLSAMTFTELRLTLWIECLYPVQNVPDT